MKLFKYILILTLSIGILNSCKKDDEVEKTETPEVAVKIGALAPEFNLADTKGDFHKLSDYRGDYVVIDFWAAWCGICRKENPNMQALHEKYKDRGLKIIGISLDETKGAWEQAISDDQLTYLHFGDQDAFKSEVATTYGITGIPLMLLLNPEGKILTITNKVDNIEAQVEKVY